MRYLSVCSGIEAATVAWHPLGWIPAAFSEIEAFPRAVLAHHYPDVPCHGDFTTIGADEYGPIDLLVGGTPCQSFSVAGLRKGLADERGNLALEYLRLADRARPGWLVWENVPGVLSSNGGKDFGAFLGGLAELGYGFAYRVLDAQHFGVPQRRRRVFVVGYLGDWRRAAAVLFERHSLSGNPPPRREKGQSAPTIPSRSSAGGGLGTDFDCDGGLIASTGDVSHCLNAGGMGRQDYETETLIAHSLRAEGFDASEDGTGRGTPLVPVTCGALTAKGTDEGMGQAAASGLLVPVCFTAKDYGADVAGQSARELDAALPELSHQGASPEEALHHLRSTSEGARLLQQASAALQAMGRSYAGQDEPEHPRSAVRRLTPRECERLQGFPDDYTLVPYRGKPAADGPRYKALGNSMAVPVMRWLGERIALVEQLSIELARAA